MAKNLPEWKPISTRLAGSPKTRCVNEILVREDLRIVKTNNWTKCNQD